MSSSATAVTGSPNKAGPDTRVAALEEQLRDSRMAEEVHQHTEAGLRDALAYAQSIVDTVREPMLVLDGKLCVATASRAFHHTFGVSPEDTDGQFIYGSPSKIRLKLGGLPGWAQWTLGLPGAPADGLTIA
jgi:PAS domain-containing protein